MDKDSLGDRQKMYEMAEAGRTLMPFLPAMIRLDGRSFSTFTRGLDRPFDAAMSKVMVETTRYLVEECNACIGYTQSDEISLVMYQTGLHSQPYFGGRIQKITSVLAAEATLRFKLMVDEHLPRKRGAWAVFDCRVWNVPTQTEAANAILWRELDATKNATSMAARAHYSHKELMDKNGKEMQEMLFAKGINFNDYPAFFKRGTYIQRRVTERAFSVDELEKLPPKHSARQNPGLVVARTDYRTLEMPPFGRVTNREAVIFEGAEPVLRTEEA